MCWRHHVLHGDVRVEGRMCMDVVDECICIYRYMQISAYTGCVSYGICVCVYKLISKSEPIDTVSTVFWLLW